MNYNANACARLPGPRKPKRVVDMNALGAPMPSAPFNPAPGPFMDMSQQQLQQQQQQQPHGYNIGGFDGGAPLVYGQTNFAGPQQTNMPTQAPAYGQYGFGPGPQAPQMAAMPGQQQQPAGNFGIFQQPIVQDMAMQYGRTLADQGKELVNKNFEKYIPLTKLKYYFAVDNRYVLHKLRLIFFPFLHSDWSLKYDHDNPVQPRYDINAPDLYIPLMAYITYIVLAGLALGIQDRFTPEQLGIQASSALAYTLFELVVYSITLYVTNIPTTLKTFDLLALSGYKYAIIVAVLAFSILLQKTGYWIALLYCSLSLGFFLLRTLKAKVLAEPVQTAASYDPYGQGNQQQFSHQVARKRKLYFLFMVAGSQPLLAFWLTMHLIPAVAKAVV